MASCFVCYGCIVSTVYVDRQVFCFSFSPTAVFEASPMPRRSPLPPREAAICERIVLAREQAALTRAELSTRTGVEYSKLASYEHARTPLPYSVGAAICAVTETCQRWLATGALPKRPHCDLDDAIDDAIPRKTLFSFAFDRVLREPIENRLNELSKLERLTSFEHIEGKDANLFDPIGTPPFLKGWNRQFRTLAVIVETIGTLPPEQREHLLQKISAVVAAPLLRRTSKAITTPQRAEILAAQRAAIAGRVRMILNGAEVPLQEAHRKPAKRLKN